MPLPASTLYAELNATTAALAAVVQRCDQDLPIPACPDWNLRQLATHVGRAHRWATEIVATRSPRFIEFRSVPDGKAPPSAAEQARWLTAGAARLTDAVRDAGEDLVWTFRTLSPAVFWARRMAHETLVHCADAQIAAGAEADIPADCATDAIDEWLTLMSGLNAGNHDLATVLPAGTALEVRTTGPDPGGAGQWLVRHTAGAGVTVLPEAGGDVALVGPAPDVLLVLMGRKPPACGDVQVTGDAALLGRWLELTAF